MSDPLAPAPATEERVQVDEKPVQATQEMLPPSAGSEGAKQDIKVYNPAEGSTSALKDGDTDSLPESFFEPTLSDVQAHHASVLARSRRLNEAPLLTSKYREAERGEKERAKKERWPNTTIRIKFSDGTMIQSVFPSSSPIQPVYAFVRSALADEVKSKGFILWQPPRNQYPEKPPPPPPHQSKKPTYPGAKTSIIPPANYGLVRGSIVQGLQGGMGGDETLYELGLVPQSVLMIKWDEEELNASGYPAPIRDELKQKSEPLPPTVPKERESASSTSAGGPPATGGTKPGEKKIPKWLQKGLMKKK
ncbi:hypothetical protein CI109_103432 [Kwoniella shandongensis]|uniref:Uncharacterized protein n=1 Tax=Kwoniella shandongensis TaxID=1734106 RepID=A0A5M6C1V1_9TREE|nr:uncharacterized protein CI109_004512 [Kwoniella shandongensis]KAA5527219.1 hypothetical protein CI109_004512 [Kwoniella shandongensis]